MDDQARQQMTGHFKMSLQCNVTPIMGFVRHTAQKKKGGNLGIILIQWAGCIACVCNTQHSTNEVGEEWVVHNVMGDYSEAIHCLLLSIIHGVGTIYGILDA